MNLKRIVSFILAISIIMTMIPINATAAEYFETNKDNVPVWSEPTKYSDKVRTISSEGTLISTSKRVKNIFGHYWYKVSGGYIYSENLRKHTEHEAMACSPDTTEYKKIDDNNHTKIVYSGEEICVCGKVMVEAKATKSTQAHTISNGKCTKCDYKEHQHKGEQAGKPKNEYENIDEKNHTLVTTTADQVCSCGKVMKKGTVTKTVQKHFFIGNTCKECGYEKGLHYHQRSRVENKFTEYQYVDESRHKKIEYTGDVYCWCNELYSEGKFVEEFDNHNFSGDTCKVCGYERPHRHEIAYSSGGTIIEYENITPEEHTKVVTTPDKYCRCNTLVSSAKTTKTVAKHIFVGNKCKDCNYEKSLHVHNNENVVGNETEYDKYNETYHQKIKHSGYIYCTCGELIAADEVTTSNEKHNFKDNICTLCGYKKETHIHVASVNKNATTSYGNSTDTHHTLIIYTGDEYCKCNKFIREGSYQYKEEKHNFNEQNVCVDCGYILVQNYLENALDQIIEGGFSNSSNLVGTTGEIILSELPVIGAAADIRDLIASIVEYESLTEVAINTLAILPLGSSLKHADEVNALLKNADNISSVVEKINNTSGVVRVSVKNGDEVIEIVTIVAKNTDDVEAIIKRLNLTSNGSSKILGKNMEIVGIVKPDYPHAAHHIVASGHPDAAEARAILEEFGININHPSNGVFLPRVKDVEEGAYHPSMHTKDYFKEVNSLLREAESKEDALDILEQIAEDLRKKELLKQEGGN